MVMVKPVNRRRLLAGGAGALAVGAALTQSTTAQSATTTGGFGLEVEPFLGANQSGILTTPQAHALFISLDLVASDSLSPPETLRRIMRLWTADARRLTQGDPALADTEPELATRPSRLTVTVGLGAGVFDQLGAPALRPDSLRPIPAFSNDRLESRWCGGDLLLQICADDPVVVAHATRVLMKNIRTLAVQRWRQSGFRRANGAAQAGTTMRNLMGQIDGTNNLPASAFATNVWDDGSEQSWFRGGTVLVLRRIRAEMDSWDELDRRSKELAVGRRLDSGAPLTGQREFDRPDLSATVNGIEVIPPNAHIAVAHHRNPREQFLRRPYNYDDPPARGETTDSGLLFATYQNDPARQFVPVQQRLADSDAMNQWITTIGSAMFAIPPGVAEDGYLGQALLDQL